MFTRDNIQTAKAIALECGILDSGVAVTEPTVIEGRAFRALSEGDREAIAEKITVCSRKLWEYFSIIQGKLQITCTDVTCSDVISHST